MPGTGVHVFDLPPLTRRLASERRTAVVGFDMQTQTLKAAIPAVLVGVLIGAMFSQLLGVFTMLPGAAAGGAVYWLIAGRASTGLRVRHYQRFLDRRRVSDDILVCWRPMASGSSTFIRFLPGSVPLAHQEPSSV